MAEPNSPGERSSAQRQADHDGLARLSETLVPALVSKLNASGLGELEVREGDWRIRLRRPAGGAPFGRRAERPRLGVHPPGHAPAQGAVATTAHAAVSGASGAPGAAAVTDPEPRREAATSPAVGVFRPGVSVGTRVRAGDRIAIVDLLGIPQDVVAPIDGVLAEVLAQGGDAVEYGEEVAVVEAPPERAPTGDGDPADREA